MCVHTHIPHTPHPNTCIHTHSHTLTYTHIFTCTHMYYTHTPTPAHIFTHSHTLTHTHSYMHTNTHIHITHVLHSQHMYSHTLTHAHSHTPHILHPHPMNHTLIYPDLTSWSLSMLPQGTLGFCSQGPPTPARRQERLPNTGPSGGMKDEKKDRDEQRETGSWVSEDSFLKKQL